ncbi:protein 5NUC-like [Chelonus insularis]|uniref:protein 5NUC-like n=1 Tax=Chelonus insularis TaxID=460826 RepID=UPI00158BB1A5|nr:protein 5NUC-like [Chelonus insularis]
MCGSHFIKDVKSHVNTNTPTQWTLQILHTNDMHSRFEETSSVLSTCTQRDKAEKKCYGGFARIAHLVRKWKQSAYPTLFLNAGDTFQGTAWYYLYKWEIVAKFLNILKPDVITLGNHEFDNGIDGLLPFLKNASFPIVVSNLDLSEEPEIAAIVKKSIVLNVNGRKIGIVGYVTSEPGIVHPTGRIIVKNEIESIRNEINRLKKEEGVNIFIGLGHSGYEVDKKIAAEVEDLDLIVGGHSHSFLSNGIKLDKEIPTGSYPTAIKQKNGKIVYIVQAYESTKYIGRLFATFDNDGNIIDIFGKPMLLDYKVPQAPDVLQELEKYRPGLDEFKNKPIGYSKVLLMGERDVVRKRESNLGNLITDAMIEYNLEQYTGHDGWTDAAIATINGGAIRCSINKTSGEPLTYEDAIHAFALGNVIGKTKLKGWQIVQMLEHSVAQHEIGRNDIQYSGQFLHFSGLQVTYDLTQPVGSRVLYRNGVLIRCSKCLEPKYYKLHLNRTYTIIMDTFLYGGGNGYTMIKTENSTWTSLDVPLDIVLAKYVEKTKYYIHAESNKRIKFYSPQRTSVIRKNSP